MLKFQTTAKSATGFYSSKKNSVKPAAAYEDPYDCIETAGFKTFVNVKSDSIYGDKAFKKSKSVMDCIEKNVPRR